MNYFPAIAYLAIDGGTPRGFPRPHMEPIPCVFHERLPEVRLYLRRFVMDGHCPHDFGDGYRRCCNAMTPLRDVVPVMDERGCFPQYPHPPHNDLRWPKHCEGCGGEFRPEHHWQVHIDHLYRNTITGDVTALRDLPVGAMWYQDFGHGPDSRFMLARYGDALLAAGGIPPMSAVNKSVPHLFVRTPGGVWDMDTIATNGDGWELTGEPPKITAHPSIDHRNGAGSDWHGWLRDGILTQC